MNRNWFAYLNRGEGHKIRLIIGYILKMLPSVLLTLPRVLVFRGSIYFSRKRRGLHTNITHELGLIFFNLFLVALASQTVIPKIVLSAGKIQFIGGDIRRINLVPLNKLIEVRQIVLAEGYFSYFLIEVMGNIALFAIMGFMLPLLWRRFERIKYTILTCFGISLFIEVVQLLLPRATDIDDILLNTLGGIIGCLLYKLAAKKAPQAAESFKY